MASLPTIPDFCVRQFSSSTLCSVSSSKATTDEPYCPKADQPQAIERLVSQIQRGDKYSVLRGITGTGKTLVIAHSISKIDQKKILVLCHNKTLAAQLARELRTHLQKHQVHLFVSYYNHYVPESFNEVTERFHPKKSSINEEIDALRHMATRALVQEHQQDSSKVVVVASVSCIYGLGMPKSYLEAAIHLHVGDIVGGYSRDEAGSVRDPIKDLVDNLEAALYTPFTPSSTGKNSDDYDSNADSDLKRGQYELSFGSDKDATLHIWPPTEIAPLKIYMDHANGPGREDESSSRYRVTRILQGNPSGEKTKQVDSLTIFPAKHHIISSDDVEERPIFEEAMCRIQDELKIRVEELRSEAKHTEAERLSRRVSQDLVLLRETRTCPGVENYSRHLALREAGEPPDTLLDYMGHRVYNKSKRGGGSGSGRRGSNGISVRGEGESQTKQDWLLVVDESHVTLPQLKAMYAGDRARKEKLVKHGFRLPSALDNRPLRDDEFWERIPQAVFVSATPAKQEMDLTSQVLGNEPIDMVIRPTYVCDPSIEVRPRTRRRGGGQGGNSGMLENLLGEIRTRAERKERTLVVALTKRDAEDFDTFLREKNVSSTYIHSGLTTHERSNALKSLQLGEIDCLVGVNLLREGLDLPEVSLVVILNADSEGFLRSETALLQFIGRAARNKSGAAILYADRVTGSMTKCIEITSHRRKIQLAYNSENQKEITSTKGSTFLSIFDILSEQIEAEKVSAVGLDFEENNTRPASIVTSQLPVPVSASNVAPTRLQIETEHLPNKPGVYLWKDDDANVLYVGKAKKLRSRVKSYVAPSAKHSSRIRSLMTKARNLDFAITQSERDALVLEEKLIKHHQPLYNVLLKDDGFYPYLR